MSKILTPFGAYLHKWKIDNGVTDAVFCKAVHINRTNMNLIEHGKRELKLHETFSILKFIDIPRNLHEGFIDLATSGNKTMTVDLTNLNNEKRVVAYYFATTLDKFDTVDINKIYNVIKPKL